MNNLPKNLPSEAVLDGLGYRIERVATMKPIDYRFTELVHTKSGGRIILTDRKDNYKTFSIIFRTTPTDDTGVFHILEHSVLAGSEKFPLKDPFTEVLKGSLNVYMNAFTSSSSTYFPFTTPSDKDFFGLAEVYLDAVFRPLAKKNECIFLQEGHRVEFDENGVPFRTGVVYNEMEGVYSSLDDFADYEICKLEYPSGTFAYDSGGHPDHIHELTYEQFKSTYEKFYRPECCMVFLDGTLDAEKALTLIASYFDGYEARGDVPSIDMGGEQIVYNYLDENAVLPSCHYPVQSEEDTKCSLFLRWRGPKSALRAENLALQYAVNLLAQSNASPFVKEIIDTGLCTDVSLEYRTSTMAGFLECIIEGIEQKDANALVGITVDTLRRLCDEGLSLEELSAEIKHREFISKLADTGSTPVGIAQMGIFRTAFAEGSDPVACTDFDAIFGHIKQIVAEGGCERLLKEYALDTLPVAMLMIPDQELNARRMAQRDSEVRAIYAEGTEARRIAEEKLASLRRWQQTEDSEEALAALPTLKIEDVGELGEPVNCVTDIRDGVPVIHNLLPTSGVPHYRLYFDISDFPADKLYLIELYNAIRRDLPTECGSCIEFATKVKTKLGAFSRSYAVMKQRDSAKLFYLVTASALTEDLCNLPEILREGLYTVDNSATDIIKRGLDQLIMRLPEDIETGASDLALSRALGMFDASEALKDKIYGIDYIKRLKQIDTDGDLTWLSEEFERMKDYFTPDRLVITCTDTAYNPELADIIVDTVRLGAEEYSVKRAGGVPTSAVKERKSYPDKGASDGTERAPLSDRIEAIWRVLSDMTERYPCNVEKNEKKSVGIAIANGVNHANLVTNFKTVTGQGYIGAFGTANNLLSMTDLWESIRIKGGAYGAGISARYNTGGVVIHSYRDPAPEKSAELFRRVPDMLRQRAEEFEGNDGLTEYIIGAVAGLESPLSPRSEGASNTGTLMCMISRADNERRRNEILATTADDLRAVADIYEEAISNGVYAVAAPIERLKEMPFIDEIITF